MSTAQLLIETRAEWFYISSETERNTGHQFEVHLPDTVLQLLISGTSPSRYVAYKLNFVASIVYLSSMNLIYYQCS